MDDLQDEQSKIKYVYGFYHDAGQRFEFSTREEAEKYSKRYFNGKATIIERRVFENLKEFEENNPRDHLEILIAEKEKLTNQIKLPVSITYKPDKSVPYTTNNITLSDLRYLLTLANKELKDRHNYPQEVGDDEKVMLGFSRYLEWMTVELTAREFMEMNKVLKETCSKLNDTNNQIAKIMVKFGYSETLLKKLQEDIPDTYKSLEPLSFNFEMLEKDSYQDKDYLDLE